MSDTLRDKAPDDRTGRATVNPPLLIRFPSLRATNARALFDDHDLYATAAWVAGYQHELPAEALNRLCFSLLEAWPQKGPRPAVDSIALAVLANDGVGYEDIASAFDRAPASVGKLVSRGREYLDEITAQGVGVHVPDNALELAREHYGAEVDVAEGLAIPGGEDPLFGWAESSDTGERMMRAKLAHGSRQPTGLRGAMGEILEDFFRWRLEQRRACPEACPELPRTDRN